MSNLRLDNIGNRVGSIAIPIDTVLQGTAKAWINLNGTGTIAQRDSFNVSSIVDVGTGQYEVNLSASLANANYARGYGNQDASITNSAINGRNATATLVNKFGIQTYRVDTGAFVDITEANAIVHGDPV